MKNTIIATFFLAFFIVHTVSAIPFCGNQELIFLNETSDVAGYKILDNKPEISSQNITTISVTAATSPVLLGAWITRPDLKLTTIEPSLWRFRTYHDVSSTSNPTTIEFKIYNRTQSGSETSLFYDHAITNPITSLSGGGESLTSYVRRNYIYFNPGDRLVIKMYATTEKTSSVSVNVYTVGNTNASMVSMGYFDCSAVGPGSQVANASATPLDPAITISAAICAIAWFAFRKKE